MSVADRAFMFFESISSTPKNREHGTFGVVQLDLQLHSATRESFSCGAPGDIESSGNVETGIRKAHSESSESGAACISSVVYIRGMGDYPKRGV